MTLKPSSKYDLFKTTLLTWNARINLISKTQSSKLDLHILDCLQLKDHLSSKKIIDIGSGAGFPGLILALDTPSLMVTLVEQDERKAQFLKHIVYLYQLKNVVVEVKNFKSLLRPAPPITITARAVASLLKLLDLSYFMLSNTCNLQQCGLQEDKLAEDDLYNHKLKTGPLIVHPSTETYLLLLKGREYLQEIHEAESKYKFKVQVMPNLYSDGVILKINQVQKKH